MKLALICLMFGVLPASSAPKGAFAPIALYTQYQHEPPQAVLEALQDELDAIMSPIGMHFDWRALDGPRASETSAELAVVTFKGRCDAAGLTNRSRIEGALGFTHVSDGQILPFTEISCDRLRNFVQGELLGLRPEERETAFGRALGRVLAHELYHIFANTARHGSGVSKESYTVRDLVCEEFQFQHREMQLLRDNRVHGLPEAGQVKAASTPASLAYN